MGSCVIARSSQSNNSNHALLWSALDDRNWRVFIWIDSNYLEPSAACDISKVLLVPLGAAYREHLETASERNETSIYWDHSYAYVYARLRWNGRRGEELLADEHPRVWCTGCS